MEDRRERERWLTVPRWCDDYENDSKKVKESEKYYKEFRENAEKDLIKKLKILGLNTQLVGLLTVWLTGWMNEREKNINEVSSNDKTTVNNSSSSS